MGYTGHPIDWSVSQGMRGHMRAAAVQLNSTDDKDRNVEAAERLVRAAAADGAELVALPEKWNLLGGSRGAARRRRAARRPEPRARAALGARARHPPARRQHRRAGGGPGAALQHLGADRPRGRDLAAYRKIHMFDVDVGGVAYRESEHEQPGDEIVIAPPARGRLSG